MASARRTRSSFGSSGWPGRGALDVRLAEGLQLLLGPAFRLLGPGEQERPATLENELERWAHLPAVHPCSAPVVRFEDGDTADEIDAKLRGLAKLRSQLDDVIGWCAHAIRRTGFHRRLGFTSFRHYVEERLGLPPRVVEQRERFEARLWASPALQEAKRQRVRYEKLRLLATLPEEDIRSWIPRAKALTCIALRRRNQGEKVRQMRASHRIGVALPRRVAILLAAAVKNVRKLFGRLLPVGRCLAIIAAHFFDTWSFVLKRRKTLSQRVRERDGGWCLHLRVIHAGHLVAFGEAPHAITWVRKGKPFTGLAD